MFYTPASNGNSGIIIIIINSISGKYLAKIGDG
jgi:hypothetical protein